MRVVFEDGERAQLIARWGLPDNATEDQVADLVITRVLSTPQASRPVTARHPAPSPASPGDAEQLVKDALKAGKIAPERAPYWLDRLARKPRRAAQEIASMAPVYAEHPGWLSSGEGMGHSDEYPREWLSRSEPDSPLDRAHRERINGYRNRITSED